jgi:O-acetyl-ADP-ribose deacetylase (regulator of RNase III)
MQTTEEAENLSSEFESYDEEDQESGKQAIISPAEIPTLRSLYQSRRLLQRDQSFAPNDTYNQMISFCHYDLTRLRVDAIVNNAPANFKARHIPTSLHRAIFKAGGSGLRREARSKARVKVGQVELTHGHDLPSSWVIHAVAPTYTGSKGVGQFNVLSECYRSALRTAISYELKTIAFPCLGTGGCNFPPRVAARIALQEIREYLDEHPEHRLQRIIFCIRTAADEKAYTDFLPVFFPPTHGDLDRARTSDWSADRAAVAAHVLATRTQLQDALTEVSNTYDFGTQSAVCAHDMRRIDSTLTSIRNFLLGSKELKQSLGDLNLLCSVVLAACADILEMAERARTLGLTREAQFVWIEANTAMRAKYGFDLTSVFDYCWIFANSLDDVLTNDIAEPDAMARARQILDKYGVKQKGQDTEGIRDHLDEVLYVDQSERPAPRNRGLVQLHQMPSVAKLYLLGHLEAKPTMARPSNLFNHTVCLLREDITRLEVDIVVNSTDPNFSGMGTLDRSVFKKGGEELCEVVKQFGKCEPGDVKATLGYSLPAKHILHVVPPEQFRKDTKNVLRNIYREILHTAVLMKATSMAIPSIGTGMRNYPRRDCVSLAMEEVKRFLESVESGNGLQKIVFVVFSSTDEFVYRSLLPTYFPPCKDNTSTTVSVKQPAETEGSSSSSFPVPANRPSLSISVDEAPRGVRSGKQPATLRPLSSDEYQAFMRFESHVIECNICGDGLFERTRKLCEQGYPLAQTILRRMEMSDDANIYTKAEEPSQREKLEAPVDLLPGSMLLLSNVAEGTHNSPEGPYIEVGKPNRTNHDELILKNSSVSKDSNDIAQATEQPAVVLGAQAGASKVTPDGNSYSQSNQRLHDIKDDRDCTHRNEEKIDALSITKVSSDIAASPGGESKDPKPASGRATFNKRILAHLDHDLKNRPGSYIGRHVKDIAFAFELHPKFISHALEQLALEGKVHNTVDSDMWVISKPSTELPPIEQQDRLGEPSVTDTDALADQILLRIYRAGHGLSILDLTSELQSPTAVVLPAIRQLAAKWYVASWDNDEMWGLTSIGSARAVEMQKELAETEQQVALSVNPDEDPSRDLSQRALSYLRSLPGLSENISHLATTFDTPIAELQPVLEQLGSDGLIETKGDESSWTAILPPNEDPSDGRSSLPGDSNETGPHPSLGSIHDSHEIPTASTPSPVLTGPVDAVPEETIQADDTPGTPNQTTTTTDNPHLDAPASEQKDHSGASQQEHSTPKSPITSRASSWRDGRGANMRQRTKSSRALREDIEEDVESGTASSLRYARMAKEKKHNKWSRARTDDIEDELECYDGQEEDYVDDEVAPT